MWWWCLNFSYKVLEVYICCIIRPKCSNWTSPCDYLIWCPSTISTLITPSTWINKVIYLYAFSVIICIKPTLKLTAVVVLLLFCCCCWKLYLGSGSIIQQLVNIGFIDEYELVVVPIILGDGKYLFKDVKMTEMNLIESQLFQNGVVSLRYQPAR